MLRYMRTFGILVLAFAVTLGPVAPAFAQDPAQGQTQTQNQTQPPPPPPKKISDEAPREYSHGVSAFPNVLAPYKPLHIDNPNLTNSSNLMQFIKDGKLMIGVQDAIALALENNLDISVQRYNPWISDTNILSALAGPTGSFDPHFALNSGVQHQTQPVNNPFTTGAGAGLSALTSHLFFSNYSYIQGFETGSQLTVTMNNSRLTSGGSNLFNPSLSSSLTVNVQQQLLSGFGILPNTRFIKIAKNNQRISEYQFQAQVILTVTTAQNDYWELVFARQNVAVQETAVKQANTLYEDNQKQVKIGTMAPLDVVQSQANLAAAESALINAQTAVLLQQTQFLSLLTKNPLAPELKGLEIIPTDSTYIPVEMENQPLDQAVREALTNRPEYKQLQISLESDDISVRANRNLMLPSLTLNAQYGWAGLAGNRTLAGGVIPGSFTANLNSPIVNAAGTPVPNQFTAIPVTSPSTVSMTGLSDALYQLVTSQFPSYVVSFNLTIPIRNRVQQAATIASELIQRQDQVRLQQEQSVIAVDVHNAQIQFTQARAALTSAVQQRVLEEKTLDAENKKLQLGASTPYQVVLIQRDLATAASNEVRAQVNLVEAKVALDKAMGRTLQANNIQTAENKSGGPARETLIPGTHADGSIVIDNPRN
jgi:outer membrane protein